MFSTLNLRSNSDAGAPNRWLPAGGIMLLVCILAAGAQAQPTVVDPDWALVRTYESSGAMAARWNPVDGAIYFGRRGSGADGLYRFDRFGIAERRVGGSNIAGVLVEPDSGHVYVSEDYGGVVYRTDFGAMNRTTWVSGFAGGDDDPIGMDIAPPGHASGVLQPGEALVVDRGYNGADGVWRWSPHTAQGAYAVWPDGGMLVDAVDVAIGVNEVYVADGGAGTIYVLQPDSTLTALSLLDPVTAPEAIDVDPATGDLLVLDRGSGRLVRIDPGTGEVATILDGLSTTGLLWSGVEVHPTGRRLLVTDHGTGQIHVLAMCDAAGYPELDCNGNGIDDLCETAQGLADDCNQNGIPDDCELADNDCNGDGRLDDCPVCPPVQAVFIMDTSTSMDDEAAALCSSLALIVDYLQASDIAVEPTIFGICDNPGGAYGCLQAVMTDSLGSTVPGFPPANLAVLGECPGGAQVCQEDWGRAVAVAAGSYPWAADGESIRLVIPVSDEGPWCGDSITQDDLDSIAHAITVARDHDVIVSPITGTGSGATVITLAQEIAAATGGLHYSSSESVSEIAGGIVDLVSGACAAFTDCDANGTLDECDIASHPSRDFNGDGVLDTCQQGQGVSGVEPGRALRSRLYPGYPNPFNPQTTIAFELPMRQAVDLRVFDISGRLVKVLADGEHYEAGRHELVWNGRDDEGRQQASGTYFYRLSLGGHVQTQRVVLIK